MKILLVEDDRFAGELLAATLSDHYYTVDIATDGQAALDLASLWNYDLITLDIQIPKLDGVSVCRQLRSQGYSMPILILTAQDSNDDIIRGLDAGADDYVTKPFDSAQLLARIRALLRRRGIAASSNLLTWGNLCLDPTSAQVTYNQQAITLRPKEYKLLELFLRNPQRIFSRNAILDDLWTIDDCPTEHAVTNLIKDLRRDLKAAGMTAELIETVYGLGYRLNVAPSSTSPVAMPDTAEGCDRPVEPITSQRTNNGQGDQTLLTKNLLQGDRSKGLSAIARITERFKASLAERLHPLAEVATALQQETLSAEQRQAAKEEAHRLAGNLGTFGYARGSELARAIEHLLAVETTLEPAQISQFLHLFAELQQAVNQPSTALTDIPAASTTTTRVLLIGEPTELTEALYRQAPDWELQIDCVSPSSAIDRIAQTPPSAIVLMLGDATTQPQSLALLQQIKQHDAAIPVLVLATQDGLSDRVEVARLGAERYISQPTNPFEVLQAVTHLLPQTQASDARVMIVDDDPLMLATIVNLLKPWGLQTISVSNPHQFWEVLTSFQPNLLLLDIEMPTFNGIELCQVVRQDPKHSDLPILVVTSHTEQALMQQVFAAGADDFITKPIIGPELVSRVISRIERSRLRQQLDHLRQQQTQLLQQQARTDVLTQIYNRRAFDEYLQQQWQQLMQEQAPLSLVLCDVDCFKAYNDRYGHPVGDDCLKQIARTIEEALRLSSDRVARYGGEEFGIILPNTTLNGALWIADRIQQAIAQLHIPHKSSAVAPYVTLSMGITGTIPTPEKTVAELITTADRALYAAKEKGRNTYCLHPY